MRWLRKIPTWVLICFVISPLVMIGGCVLMIYDVPYAGWPAFVGFVVTSVAGCAVAFFDVDPLG